MNLERLLANAAELHAIPAPTFHEHERAAYLRKLMEAVGAGDSVLDAAGNVITTIPGIEPPLIVSAHLDTVFDVDVPLTLRRTEGALHGAGIGDNTIAVAALVELAAELIHTPTDHKVLLVGNVAEEGLGNLAGMRALVDRMGKDVIAYLVLEGFSQNILVTRGLSIRRYRIKVTTRGGHPWAHSDRPSAIHLLTSLAHAITSRQRWQWSRLTVNIGRIEGGTSINTIASSAFMDIDVRSLHPNAISRFDAFLHQLCTSNAFDKASVELERIGERPAGEISPDAPLVRKAIASLQKAGIASIKMAVGSTDANIPLSLGLPSVCMGLTKGGNAHTTEEFIEVEPLHRGFAALLNLVRELTSNARES